MLLKRLQVIVECFIVFVQGDSGNDRSHTDVRTPTASLTRTPLSNGSVPQSSHNPQLSSHNAQSFVVRSGAGPSIDVRATKPSIGQPPSHNAQSSHNPQLSIHRAPIRYTNATAITTTTTATTGGVQIRPSTVVIRPLIPSLSGAIRLNG